jgi:hypothetical protein
MCRHVRTEIIDVNFCGLNSITRLLPMCTMHGLISASCNLWTCVLDFVGISSCAVSTATAQLPESQQHFWSTGQYGWTTEGSSLHVWRYWGICSLRSNPQILWLDVTCCVRVYSLFLLKIWYGRVTCGSMTNDVKSESLTFEDRADRSSLRSLLLSVLHVPAHSSIPHTTANHLLL